MVTDTPENQRNNVLDELFELTGGQKKLLDAKDPAVVVGLYAWTLPPHLEPQGAPTTAEVSVRVGSTWTTCTETTVPMRVQGVAATFRGTECPDFLWTHGPTSLVDEQGRLRWKVTVLEAGRFAGGRFPPEHDDRDVTGWEGFFDPRAFDDAWLARRSLPLSRRVVEQVGPRTAKLVLSSGRQPLAAADAERLLAATCTDPAVRAWNEDRCRALEERTCDDAGCSWEAYGNCTAFLLGGGRALTAAHCAADLVLDDAKRARSGLLVPDAAGAPRRVELGLIEVGKQDFAHHWVSLDEEDPVDVAVITVDDGGLAPWPVAELPAVGGVVFIAGYPRLEGRSPEAVARRGYALTAGVARVSFGKVADRNEDDRTFCNVDGNQEHWRLAEECPVGEVTLEGEPTWKGPLTRSAFLGTWDTVNGYSGAPLFDVEGRLVGVNSTVMSPHSPQERYSTEMFAVATPARRALGRLGVSPLSGARERGEGAADAVVSGR